MVQLTKNLAVEWAKDAVRVRRIRPPPPHPLPPPLPPAVPRTSLVLSAGRAKQSSPPAAAAYSCHC